MLSSSRALLVYAVSCICVCQAFLTTHPDSRIVAWTDRRWHGQKGDSSWTLLNAKKKRRRRKDIPAESSGDTSSTDLSDSDELPDFEIFDELEEPKPKKKIITDPDTITPAMMGSTTQPVGSVKDLLSDRSLESKLEFDEAEEDTSLPDLLELSRNAGDSDAPMGKKKARQAQRKAAAIAAKEAAKEEPSFVSNLPFLLDEKGKLSPVKVLETGAWGGIFLLIGWEIYLNSPFFERAAPMAPVVFENLYL